MCTNCRRIYNPYARRSILVPCGKCDACRQEKACARSNRIRNNITMGTSALFITLTYTNDYVPFVFRSDLYGDNYDINIYRRAECRFTYNRHAKKFSFRKEVGIHPIGVAYVPFENRSCSVYDSSLENYKSLVGLGRDFIGVPYFRDLQNFFKRLRVILNRHYNYDKKFSYFSCSELGAQTFRPHFHALLFVPSGDEQIFRSAVLEAWPYADRDRTKKYIEQARDAASYVSSYVNSHTGLYPLFEISDFKPKHSASKDFGVVLDCFSLPQILEKIDRGDLSYYRKQKFDGETDVSAVSIPEYVINRYFPKCKGFGWLSSSQLRSILLAPERVGDVFRTGQYECFETNTGKRIVFDALPVINHPLYKFTPNETYAIYVRIKNSLSRFIRETGLNAFDYADYYQRAWNLHYSQCLKMSHKDIEVFSDYSDFYENANDVVNGVVSAPTLDGLDLQVDPNNRSDVLLKTNHYRSLYSKLDKQKKVTNYCMAHMGHYV